MIVSIYNRLKRRKEGKFIWTERFISLSSAIEKENRREKKKTIRSLILLLLPFHQRFHLAELFEEFQDSLLIVVDLFDRTIFDFVHRLVNLNVISSEKVENRQAMLDLVDFLEQRVRLIRVDAVVQQSLQRILRFGFGRQI